MSVREQAASLADADKATFRKLAEDYRFSYEVRLAYMTASQKAEYLAHAIRALPEPPQKWNGLPPTEHLETKFHWLKYVPPPAVGPTEPFIAEWFMNKWFLCGVATGRNVDLISAEHIYLGPCTYAA